MPSQQQADLVLSCVVIVPTIDLRQCLRIEKRVLELRQEVLLLRQTFGKGENSLA